MESIGIPTDCDYTAFSAARGARLATTTDHHAPPGHLYRLHLAWHAGPGYDGSGGTARRNIMRKLNPHSVAELTRYMVSVEREASRMTRMAAHWGLTGSANRYFYPTLRLLCGMLLPWLRPHPNVVLNHKEPIP